MGKLDKLNSFVGYLQLFSDNTEVILSSSCMAAYLVRTVFLNLRMAMKTWIIQSRTASGGFYLLERALPNNGSQNGKNSGNVNQCIWAFDN